MIPAACLPVALLCWLLCARFNYRIAVRRGWLASLTYKGGRSYECPNYYRPWHSGCCARCATSFTENFGASRRHRALLALTGPLLLLAILPWILVTGRQPLSASEREHRLKQAEKDLAQATGQLRDNSA